MIDVNPNELEPVAAPIESNQGAPAPVEIDVSTVAGLRAFMAPDAETETVEGEVVLEETDRDYLNSHAGELIKFLELVDPKNDDYPDIDEVRIKIAAADDLWVSQLADALRMYEAASAAIPGWLMNNIGKVARAVVRAQGLS